MPRVSRWSFVEFNLWHFKINPTNNIQQPHVEEDMFLHGSGRQKYEMFTIQFPLCESSSTLENRILMPSCKYGANQV